MSPLFANFLIALLVLGSGVWVLRPVAAAIAKRIAGEHRPAGMDREERDEVMTELQQVRHELAELAERVDFAERLLAQQRDAAALPKART